MMIRAEGEINELWLTSTGLVGGRIACAPSIQMAPGQYVLAQRVAAEGDFDAWPAALFAYPSASGALLAAPPLPPGWKAGERLRLRGPCGKGYRLPQGAQRVALAALDGNPYRLEGLLHQALARQSEVTLYCAFIPAGLPLAVEILPLDLLPEALRWADYLAIETTLKGLPDMPARLGFTAGQSSPCPTQVLVFTDMPCGGTAECGVCAVRTRKGWRLACVDGPVFDYNAVELR